MAEQRQRAAENFYYIKLRPPLKIIVSEIRVQLPLRHLGVYFLRYSVTFLKRFLIQ
jgi:hypothetical protein